MSFKDRRTCRSAYEEKETDAFADEHSLRNEVEIERLVL